MIKKEILIPDPGCMASEIGKIVANKCLDKNISLDTMKLENLLILMQVEYIRQTKKMLFQENIIVFDQQKLRIREVAGDFLAYYVGMFMIPTDTRFREFITLLDKQEEVVDSIINKYGNLDNWDFEEIPDIQLIYKIAEEFNTQNIQPPLIFYGLERFSNIYLESNGEHTLSEKKQVKVLQKIKGINKRKKL